MTTSFAGPTAQVRARASVLALCLALFASCSLNSRTDDDTTSQSEPGATASHVGATTPTDELRTKAALGYVVGRLPPPRRKAVRQQVTAVIDRWWESAYLSTDAADADGASAFPGFTPGARQRARTDVELMTNARLRSSSVTPLMRKVNLDVLSVNKRARSVTARFDLRLRVTGANDSAGAGDGAGTGRKRMQLRGRLFLTHQPGGWKVFGYDVSKGWL